MEALLEKQFVYIGTYTSGDSDGIYIYQLDLSKGTLEYVSMAPGVDNPSFLAIDSQQRFLYAVNEISEFNGKTSGAVSAFSINSKTGTLSFLNQQPTGGPGPCHLGVDQTGSYVLVANYHGGSICVLPIREDGTLGKSSHFIQHEGSSVNPTRQTGPHAHSITLDSNNRYAFVADLGIDKVMVYSLDLDRGILFPKKEPSIQVQTGAGPRHFDFHPKGSYAYLINELNSTLTAFRYDESYGILQNLHTVSTLPKDFEGNNSCADVHVSPSGNFIYGSNRGHNSIVIFQVNKDTGKLTYVGHESTRGEIPRGFTIDPTGSFLLAANQNSNNVIVFRIDQLTGKLTPTGHEEKVPTPVCIKTTSTFS